MKKEEHKSKLEEVLNNLQDQGKVTEILAEITNDYEDITTKLDTFASTNEKLTQDAESLRAANMKLFLQIGSTPKPEDIKPEPEPDAPKEKKTFENLFDEKGGLK